jgi:hypothetical protein
MGKIVMSGNTIVKLTFGITTLHPTLVMPAVKIVKLAFNIVISGVTVTIWGIGVGKVCGG